MIDTVLSAAAAPALGVGGMMDVGRGVITGALLAAAALFAGFAILKRSAVAGFAFAALGFAAAYQAAALEFSPALASAGKLLFLCLFGAASLLFVTAAIQNVRNNSFLSFLMFAGALTLAGIGAFSVFSRTDMGGLVRPSIAVAGLTCAGLAGLFASREQSARILLPGILIALLAGGLGAVLPASMAIFAHGVFAVGVLAASLVALLDADAARFNELGLHAEAPAAHPVAHPPAQMQDRAAERAQERARVSENQLAQVLDYSGIAVLDWSPESAHQTGSLSLLMGADSAAPFTPEALRGFIHKDDVAKFESRVLDSKSGDGAFDVTVRLHSQKLMRFRGARAVAHGGEIERLVAFVEPAQDAQRRPVSIFGGGAAQPQGRAAQDPLAAGFAAALDNGEIVTVFQPIVSLATGKVAGYEALARWRGKDGGEHASADALVRAAHAGDKQDALAALVLKNATEFLCDRLHGVVADDVFVAMNVSIRQAQSPLFAEAVRALISDHKLKPKTLVLELTETEALTDVDAARKAFATLAEAGAALALDDFGAGFSSLSHLKQFHFDYLKIDKSFIRDLTDEKGGGKIAKALAALAQDLGVAVIAEGVETLDMGEVARLAGCAFGQGFAFGAPAPDPIAATVTLAPRADATPVALHADAAHDHNDAKPAEAATPAATDISPALAALSTSAPHGDIAAESGELVADAHGEAAEVKAKKPKRGFWGRSR